MEMRALLWMGATIVVWTTSTLGGGNRHTCCQYRPGAKLAGGKDKAAAATNAVTQTTSTNLNAKAAAASLPQFTTR